MEVGEHVRESGPMTRVPGWLLFLVLSALTVLVCLLSFLKEGGEAGLHAWVRDSARFATAYFGTAFVTSSLVRLWPVPWTLWLRHRRRAMGLSFALAMTIHLAGLTALWASGPEAFIQGTGLLTWFGGGTAYGFIYLLAFTSSDAAQRALGLRNWQRLHTFGGWVIWIVFTQTLTFGVLAGEGAQWVPALFMWGVAGLRLVTFRR